MSTFHTIISIMLYVRRFLRQFNLLFLAKKFPSQSQLLLLIVHYDAQMFRP